MKDRLLLPAYHQSRVGDLAVHPAQLGQQVVYAVVVSRWEVGAFRGYLQPSC